MARLLSRTLIRTVTSSSETRLTITVFDFGRDQLRSLGPTSVLTHNHLQQRHRSSKSGKAQVIELHLDSGEEVELELLGGFRKLEDIVQSVIAKRSAPDWLPFIPGSSYWVPPRLVKSVPQNVVQVVGKMSSASSISTTRIGRRKRLSGDEAMALATDRGWPSSAYFIEHSMPTHSKQTDGKTEVKIYGQPNKHSEPENEDE